MSREHVRAAIKVSVEKCTIITSLMTERITSEICIILKRQYSENVVSDVTDQLSAAKAITIFFQIAQGILRTNLLMEIRTKKYY